MFYLIGTPEIGDTIYLKTDETLLELEIVVCMTPDGKIRVAEVLGVEAVGSPWYEARVIRPSEDIMPFVDQIAYEEHYRVRKTLDNENTT